MRYETEWAHPSTAAQADFGSQQRLLAGLIATMLDLNQKIEECEVRSEERKLQVLFDNCKSISFALAALLKAGGVA